jgi:hypothetical protein
MHIFVNVGIIFYYKADSVGSWTVLVVIIIILQYYMIYLFVWRCTTCGHTLQAKQIKDGNTSLTEELRKLDRTDSEVLEEFLKKYATILPDTHQVTSSPSLGTKWLF